MSRRCPNSNHDVAALDVQSFPRSASTTPPPPTINLDASLPALRPAQTCSVTGRPAFDANLTIEAAYQTPTFGSSCKAPSRKQVMGLLTVGIPLNRGHPWFWTWSFPGVSFVFAPSSPLPAYMHLLIPTGVVVSRKHCSSGLCFTAYDVCTHLYIFGARDPRVQSICTPSPDGRMYNLNRAHSRM